MRILERMLFAAAVAIMLSPAFSFIAWAADTVRGTPP